MIGTLTMNPAIDRTVTVDGFRLGTLNRVRKVRVDASGKGINVSKALIRFGEQSLAMGLLGGMTGQFIEQDLQNDGILPAFTWIKGQSTRTNVKVFDAESGSTTEINEPGPEISSANLQALRRDLFSGLGRVSYLVCSGSLPPGVPDTFYADVIREAQAKGVHCILDTSGSALARGMHAVPTLVKPNREEASQVLGVDLRSEAQIIEAVHRFLDIGIPYVVISLGPDGAVVATGESIVWAQASVDMIRSTAGCGDALVAAVVWSLCSGKSWLEVARFATAAATATASLDGTIFPTMDMINSFSQRVCMKNM